MKVTMTEETARTKWCPHREQTRLALNEIMMKTGSFESIESIKELRLENCIASNCMMWVDSGEMPGLIDGKIPSYGYCGLIGNAS